MINIKNLDPPLVEKIKEFIELRQDQEVAGFMRIKGNRNAIRDIVLQLKKGGIPMDDLISEINSGWDFVLFGLTPISTLVHVLAMDFPEIEYIGLSNDDQIKPK